MNVIRITGPTRLVFEDDSSVVVDETGQYHPAEYVINHEGDREDIEPGAWRASEAIGVIWGYDNACE